MADIKYNDHSISSAFKDHYIVPDYQREYVWTDEQVEQLMVDLLDAYNTDNKKAYFLGTIVTYDSGSQFELIDVTTKKLRSNSFRKWHKTFNCMLSAECPTISPREMCI